jgi:iron complex transport system ATP-binding protein
MTYVADLVTVRIGRATLLEEASLELRPGEVVAVAGPNGAGKSTLLAVLAGDRSPNGGEVTLDGRAVADWPRIELARRRAVMGTDRAVAFAFTATEVAMMGRMPLHGGDPDEADHAVIDALLAAVDCVELAERVYATLSTDVPGEDDGAGRYLLLDEPTSSLDPAHQHTAMRLIRRTADAGRGVLAVVHDLNLAAAYADRVVLMHEAHVVESGTPAEVLRADLLESVFDIPMLVIPHPQLSHPLVIAEPQESLHEAPPR